MRIAVFHNLPPGGAKRAVFELVRATATDHAYDFFRIDLGSADRWPDQVGHQDIGQFSHKVVTRTLRGIGSTSDGWRIPTVEAVVRLHRRIAADIDEGGYDLAFVHHDQYLSSPALLRWLRTTSVYYCQEARRRSFEHLARADARRGLVSAAADAYELLLRRRDLAAARAADHVLCSSLFSAECIERGYGRPARVCRLGFDNTVFAPSAGTRSGRFYVLSVGALDPMKGHDFVIRALASMPVEARPGLDVVCERGGGDYAGRLTALADEKGVELTLHRAISDAELAELYASALCTAGAAHMEPFGLTVLESLGCGTPVVAVEEGGYRETVVDGVNGYLVARDPRSFAAAILRLTKGELAANVIDPPGGIDAWSWDEAGDRLLEAFDRAARARSVDSE